MNIPYRKSSQMRTALPSWIWLCTVTDCPTRKNKEDQEKKAKRISEIISKRHRNQPDRPFTVATRLRWISSRPTTRSRRCSTVISLVAAPEPSCWAFLASHQGSNVFSAFWTESVDWGSPRNMTWDTFYGKTFFAPLSPIYRFWGKDILLNFVWII